MRDVNYKAQCSWCVEFSSAGEGKGLVVRVLEGTCVGFSLPGPTTCLTFLAVEVGSGGDCCKISFVIGFGSQGLGNNCTVKDCNSIFTS